MTRGKLGFAGRVAHYFINSKLTPLLMVFAILLGVFAVMETRARKSRKSSSP